MRNYPEIEIRLYDWLQLIAAKAGMNDVIFGDQNMPEENIPFLSVQILNITMDNRPETRINYEASMLNDVEEAIIYRGKIEINMKIISNSGAMQQAQMMKTFMWQNSSLNEMARQNIGHCSHGDTINRSRLNKAAFRQRADFMLQLHMNATYSELIGTIGTAPIDGVNQDGRVIMDETI